MNKLLFTLILSAVCCGISAQEKWTDYYQDGKVKIQYRYTDCHDERQGTHKQYVLLRFENLTSEKLSLNFSKELWYDGKCWGCDNPSPENNFNIRLSKLQVIQGSCEDPNKILKIFSKMLDMEKSSLTKFELKNITVTEK